MMAASDRITSVVDARQLGTVLLESARQLRCCWSWSLESEQISFMKGARYHPYPPRMEAFDFRIGRGPWPRPRADVVQVRMSDLRTGVIPKDESGA